MFSALFIGTDLKVEVHRNESSSSSSSSSSISFSRQEAHSQSGNSTKNEANEPPPDSRKRIVFKKP
jgi:hypothetical protein